MSFLKSCLCLIVIAAFVSAAEPAPSPAAAAKTDSSAVVKTEPANPAVAPQNALPAAVKKEETAIKIVLPKQINVPSKIPAEFDSLFLKADSVLNDFISSSSINAKYGEIIITMFVNTTGIKMPKEANYNPETGKLIGNKEIYRTYGKYILKCSITNNKWSIKYIKPGPYFYMEKVEPLIPACVKKDTVAIKKP